MSTTTSNLKLFKYDVVADSEFAFSIPKALNNNWDILDLEISKLKGGINAIGDPILTFSNTLNDNEIWLEGAKLNIDTYSQLYQIYQQTYGEPIDLNDINLNINGTPTISNDLIYSKGDINNNLTSKEPFLPGTNAWEITFSMFTGDTFLWEDRFHPFLCSTSSTTRNVDFGIVTNVGVNKGQFYWETSSDGSVWNYQAGTTSLELNTWYDIRLKYSGGSTGIYTAEFKKSNSEEEFKTEITSKTLGAVYQSDESFLEWGSSPVFETRNMMNGAIDLQSIKISYGNTVINGTSKRTQFTTFRLPDCRNQVFWGTDESIGFGYISAGLPNITGTSGMNITGQQITMSGCFYEGSAGNSYVGGGNGTGNRLFFDASRSNPIYGNSNTVQPPSIKIRVKTRYQ